MATDSAYRYRSAAGQGGLYRARQTRAHAIPVREGAGLWAPGACIWQRPGAQASTEAGSKRRLLPARTGANVGDIAIAISFRPLPPQCSRFPTCW